MSSLFPEDFLLQDFEKYVNSGEVSHVFSDYLSNLLACPSVPSGKAASSETPATFDLPTLPGSPAALFDIPAVPAPTNIDASNPAAFPTAAPTFIDASVPDALPTAAPTFIDASVPDALPTAAPTFIDFSVAALPTATPTFIDALPTAAPTNIDASVPAGLPTAVPTYIDVSPASVSAPPLPEDSDFFHSPSSADLSPQPRKTGLGAGRKDISMVSKRPSPLQQDKSIQTPKNYLFSNFKFQEIQSIHNLFQSGFFKNIFFQNDNKHNDIIVLHYFLKNCTKKNFRDNLSKLATGHFIKTALLLQNFFESLN